MAVTHYDAQGNKVPFAAGEADTGQYNQYNQQYSTVGKQAPKPTGSNAGHYNYPFGAQSTPQDYPGEQRPWWQESSATDATTADTQVAPSLNPNTTGKYNNFAWGQNSIYNSDAPAQGLSGALQQVNSRLKNGPQNAFSAADLQNMHAMAMNQLQTANQQSQAGIAGANANRGVAGNNVGGLLSQQLGVQQAGALAQGDLNERLQGLQQGVTQYNASNAASGTLGQQVNSQDQRNAAAQDEQFKAYSDEKNNAFDRFKTANQAYNDLVKQYMIQLGATSGSKDGDQIKNYNRTLLEQAARERLIALQNYNQYGAQSNPTTQQTTIQNQQYGQAA